MDTIGNFEIGKVHLIKSTVALDSFPDNSVDLVICDKSDPMIANILRILKPGGYGCFLFQDRNKDAGINTILDYGYAYAGYLLNRDLPTGVLDYFIIGKKPDGVLVKDLIIIEENYLRTHHFNLPEGRNYRSFVRLIESLTNEGELVADLFCGSGSISMAALKAGRRFIAFEVNGDRCDFANKRLKEGLD